MWQKRRISWGDICANRLGDIRKALTNGADPNTDVGRGPALNVAVEMGHFEVALALIEAKADVNKRDRDGSPPLHSAAMRGQEKCVKLLLEFKADLFARCDYGYTALFFAKGSCIEILVRGGLQVNDRGSSMYFCTPLATIFSLGDCHKFYDDAERLLDLGAEVVNRYGIEFEVKVEVGAEEKTKDSFQSSDAGKGEGNKEFEAFAKELPPEWLIEPPEWLISIVRKRAKMRKSLLTFIGVLRKRYFVKHMDHIGNVVPRDVVNMLSAFVWGTRFDPRWQYDLVCNTMVSVVPWEFDEEASLEQDE